MSHTPGPWYSHLHLSVACENDGEYGDATCITNTPEEEYAATGHSGDWIAFVPHDRDHAANARLIAAAPELLSVCQSIAGDLEALLDGDDFSGMSDAELFGVMLRSLKSVIHKAEGVTTEGTNGKERSLD